MKFIYIENYLTITRDKKLEFFAYLRQQQNFRVVNQKIILNDNSLILELEDSSNIDFAKQYIHDFFKNDQNIKIKTIKKIIQNNLKIILGFEDKKAKEVLL
jgi:hypothetical protein